MKRKLFFILLQIILVGILLVGLLLIWASFQSFATLASLLNQLASDNEFESFNVFLYQTLKLPFALMGAVLTSLAGFMLLRWGKTKLWLQEFPANARRFFLMLGEDARSFVQDSGTAIVAQGWLTIAALCGIMFVASVIRLANLDIPLGHDEAYMYSAFASRSLWHIVSDYHLPNNHVLLSIIMNLTTGLLGNHVWTLRLPTIIAGVLMVPPAYFFAKRFYSKETAILSSMLVAVFPILVQYSVLARGYVIIGLITLLLLTLADYVRVQKNRFAWLLIVILSALGFYTIPIMLFSFGALYIWLFVSCFLDDICSYDSRWDFLKYWLGSGISAALITILLYTPIIIYNYDRFFGNGFIAPLEWAIFPITTWTRLRNTWSEWTASVPLWIALLGVLGFLISLVFHKRFSRQKFPPQIAFIIWIVTLVLVRRPDMLPRFWLFLAAPLLVWSAAGIIEPLRKIPLSIGKGWNPAQVLVTVILALVLVQSVWTIPTLPSQWAKKDDMERATIYLKDYVQQGDLVTASTAHLPALRYYFDYYDMPPGYIRQSGKFQRAFVLVDEQKNETLDSVAPKIGFDLPAIDLDTAKVLVQFEYMTVYECYPVP
jgi:uncharacterized membrane protein